MKTEHQFTKPILFILFNREETTAKVFERIRAAQPRQLFIAADGPRPGVPGDIEKCMETRDIIKKVDWDCEVKTLFRESNVGCKLGVPSAIDWFFDHVDDGIILEDDCMPHESFFSFCQELLDRYREDTRVFQIGGNNFCFPNIDADYSYFFTKYVSIWGWATWKRAWQHFDINMNLYKECCDDDGLLDAVSTNPAGVKTGKKVFGDTYSGAINAWGFAWAFTCMIQNGLTILPKQNLVSNIGFSDDATHTKNNQSPFNNLPTHATSFPLKHPPYMARSRAYEDAYLRKNPFDPAIRGEFISKLKSLFLKS